MREETEQTLENAGADCLKAEKIMEAMLANYLKEQHK